MVLLYRLQTWVVFYIRWQLSLFAKRARERQKKQLNKLIIFMKTNCDMPIPAKLKVLQAAFNASILYGCESWIGATIKFRINGESPFINFGDFETLPDHY